MGLPMRHTGASAMIDFILNYLFGTCGEGGDFPRGGTMA